MKRADHRQDTGDPKEPFPEYINICIQSIDLGQDRNSKSCNQCSKCPKTNDDSVKELRKLSTYSLNTDTKYSSSSLRIVRSCLFACIYR
jgi:hypothetical protein